MPRRCQCHSFLTTALLGLHRIWSRLAVSQKPKTLLFRSNLTSGLRATENHQFERDVDQLILNCACRWHSQQRRQPRLIHQVRRSIREIVTNLLSKQARMISSRSFHQRLRNFCDPRCCLVASARRIWVVRLVGSRRHRRRLHVGRI